MFQCILLLGEMVLSAFNFYGGKGFSVVHLNSCKLCVNHQQEMKSEDVCFLWNRHTQLKRCSTASWDGLAFEDVNCWRLYLGINIQPGCHAHLLWNCCSTVHIKLVTSSCSSHYFWAIAAWFELVVCTVGTNPHTLVWARADSTLSQWTFEGINLLPLMVFMNFKKINMCYRI